MYVSFVVLTDVADSSAHVLRVAACLAEPVGGRLVLLHIFHELLLDPEMAPVAAAYTDRTQRELREALVKMTADLPVAASVDMSVEPLGYAAQSAIRQYQPLLFVVGVNREHDWFDRLLSNAALPILRATQYPLLLVPEGSPQRPTPPRHVLIAVDGHAFLLNPAARAALRLLSAWQATCSVVHVSPAGADESAPHLNAATVLQTVRQGLKLGGLPDDAFRRVSHDDVPTGIVQALAESDADLLIIVTRQRSFLNQLFHRSVTARVVRQCAVPVLLLPTQE